MAKFKTRARTLDLLGRQQIAGIPTAINELLKNAHDAYADKVDIDYFRIKNLFILRDDGVGMSKNEFETRWLTLGTESKLTNSKMSKPPIDPSKPFRESMGEKGIGRLAVASIGKQVLILTKSKFKGNIVAALINWQIFELPGLNLEDIVVPVKEFKSLPDGNDISIMNNEIINSVKSLRKNGSISEKDFAKINSTLNSFELSPIDIDNKLIGNFPLEKGCGGTFFYISPTDEILNSDIDERKNPKEATKIEKMLMGFHNTMVPEHPKPALEIVFRDYKSNNNLYNDIIDMEHFFTVEDFEMADHHFKGRFDEYGQFKGMIKIYQEKSFDHIVNWTGNKFKQTNCGMFEINLAYMQGDFKDSVIDRDNYNRIKAKADKFGGLYVYKDNIRILPYGDSDYDYLDVEKNRSKHAGFYFFSYRRMFGIINLSQKLNSNLKEKAGREGFIENKAFRQLQDILKNFFLQLAADFFRNDKTAGPKSEFWKEKRDELNYIHSAIEKRNKQVKTKKLNFEKSLSEFFNDLQSNVFEYKINEIISDADFQFGNISGIIDLDLASQKIIDIEQTKRDELTAFRKAISIPYPRGFVIKKDLRTDYDTYQEEFEKINTTILKSAFEKLDHLVDNTTQKLNIEISKRKRLEQAIEHISEEAKKLNGDKKKDVNESVTSINKRVKELTTELMIDLDDRIRYVKDKFKTLSVIDEDDIDLVSKRNELNNEIQDISIRNTNILDTIIRQLEGIHWEKDEDDNYITNDQITDALGEELEDLRERVQTDIELSQLGLAVGVIHHEFNSTVKSIRSSLKDLRAWSDVNEQLDGVYKNIKMNFEHLDGYLNLFTPLNRRLSRKNEEIKLMEVKHFLIDLFKSRFERHNIEFKHTVGFARRSIHGFRSTFYPVFVNVIDNAIYWLNDSPSEEKIIRLHAEDDGIIYISNNGTEIPPQDKNKIFQLGFSRKENGRGMGLHISNEVLEPIGYKITLDEPRKNSTVTFKIAPLNYE
jgi:signal transduction histidine kinase